MLLAGTLCARPESATAYSAKPPAAELITRSPGLKSLTSLPTASTSPAHSRPTMVPGPPTAPWRWPEATARSARFSDAAFTLIRSSWALGEGLGASLYWTPFSVTAAAFMVVSLCRGGPIARRERLRGRVHWVRTQVEQGNQHGGERGRRGGNDDERREVRVEDALVEERAHIDRADVGQVRHRHQAGEGEALGAPRDAVCGQGERGDGGDHLGEAVGEVDDRGAQLAGQEQERRR